MREFLEKCASSYAYQAELAMNATLAIDANVVEALQRCIFYLWALENLDADDR